MSSERYHYYDIKRKKKRYHNDSCEYKSSNEFCRKDCVESLGDSFESTDATISQDANALSLVEQTSEELIWIKDSCNVDVSTVDTQVAIQLQVAIQVALGVVISILSANTTNSDLIAEEMLAHANLEQTNKQKIVIVNSKDVEITTTDTDVAANIQVAVQVLIAVIVSILST